MSHFKNCDVLEDDVTISPLKKALGKVVSQVSREGYLKKINFMSIGINCFLRIREKYRIISKTYSNRSSVTSHSKTPVLG